MCDRDSQPSCDALESVESWPVSAAFEARDDRLIKTGSLGEVDLCQSRSPTARAQSFPNRRLSDLCLLPEAFCMPLVEQRTNRGRIYLEETTVSLRKLHGRSPRTDNRRLGVKTLCNKILHAKLVPANLSGKSIAELHPELIRQGRVAHLNQCQGLHRR